MDTPQAGFYNVVVQGENGVVAIDSGVNLIQVYLTISSLNPAFDLNLNGGDAITFMGSGFGNTATGITITLPNGSSLCSIWYVGFGMMFCNTVAQPEGTITPG